MPYDHQCGLESDRVISLYETFEDSGLVYITDYLDMLPLCCDYERIKVVRWRATGKLGSFGPRLPAYLHPSRTSAIMNSVLLVANQKPFRITYPHLLALSSQVVDGL